uniref:Uncharacterized protein n=1 Tax=Oryza brachyantha TaxID=4533 RepID=J3LI54_ORYBR
MARDDRKFKRALHFRAAKIHCHVFCTNSPVHCCFIRLPDENLKVIRRKRKASGLDSFSSILKVSNFSQPNSKLVSVKLKKGGSFRLQRHGGLLDIG